MPQKRSERIKNREQYEALLQWGMRKEKAARIANVEEKASLKEEKGSRYRRNRRILGDV